MSWSYCSVVFSHGCILYRLTLFTNIARIIWPVPFDTLAFKWTGDTDGEVSHGVALFVRCTVITDGHESAGTAGIGSNVPQLTGTVSLIITLSKLGRHTVGIWGAPRLVYLYLQGKTDWTHFTERNTLRWRQNDRHIHRTLPSAFLFVFYWNFTEFIWRGSKW